MTCCALIGPALIRGQGAAELAAEFLLAALRACLLLLLLYFLGRGGVGGAPVEPRVAMADAWSPCLLCTDTGLL